MTEQAMQERRDRENARQREYRRKHPDKTRQWRAAYILRAAARITAEREAAAASAEGGTGNV